MSPTILAVISALLFAITFLLRKQAVRYIPMELAFLVESIVYFIIPLLLFLLLPQAVKKSALHNTNGIFLALLAGIFVVVAVVLNYLALKGGFLSKVIGITSPAQIVFGVLLGLVILRENLTLIQGLGVVLSVIGVILLTK